MAWWDSENLKTVKDRSDRYKVAFPDQYSLQEVLDAQRRIEQQEANKTLRATLDSLLLDSEK